MFYKILSVIMGILLIIGGIFCTATPLETYGIIPDLIGIAIIAEGIGCILAWLNLKSNSGKNGLLILNGILSTVLGIIVLGSGLLKFGIAAAYVDFVAAWLFISGVLRIIDSFKIRGLIKDGKSMENGSTVDGTFDSLLKEIGRTWWIYLSLGILAVIAGILSFIDPFTTAITIGVMIGCDIVVSGIDLKPCSYGLTVLLTLRVISNGAFEPPVRNLRRHFFIESLMRHATMWIVE